MNRIIFIITLSFFSITKSYSQTEIPKEINDEFAFSIIDNYLYGNGNTKLFIRQKLVRKGYKPMEIDVLVESIHNNSKNRNIILEVFYEYFGSNRESLYMNLKSLGMSATASKCFTDYIIGEKYKPAKSLNKKDDSLSKLSNVTSNNDSHEKKIQEPLVNLLNYSPKMTTVCEDQSYSDCFRDVTGIVKELAEIRKNHLKYKNDPVYLNFYQTKKAISDKRDWTKDALIINSYIIENIKIYEKNLSECDNDWAKKLPPDLYEYFNLNKTDILNEIKTKTE